MTVRGDGRASAHAVCCFRFHPPPLCLSDQNLRLGHRQVHGFLLREGEEPVGAWGPGGGGAVGGTHWAQQHPLNPCCLLQTHSAYMLFYKRVEPEEENGKDFSFDVSPDLLEVRRFSLIHPCALWLGPFSVSTSVSQWIWHDNMQFLQDKNIFEHTYFGWVSELQPVCLTDASGALTALVVAASCGSCAAASPARYRTPKQSRS